MVETKGCYKIPQGVPKEHYPKKGERAKESNLRQEPK
ncbi:hypothetical protein CASFOL_021130 [Castilleja foliolosa]|uniref:Uncharacterized protein n=1 Tax=Castilleja foliolosa TaxID=1961234 RepID=A0ABD3CZ30_9LAMI